MQLYQSPLSVFCQKDAVVGVPASADSVGIDASFRRAIGRRRKGIGQ